MTATHLSASASAEERLPTIPFVDERSLDAASRALCARAQAMMGFVPNSMRTYLHRPAIAEAVMNLSNAVQNDAGAVLDRPLKVKLGVICSATNGCIYCTSHQCNIAQQLQARNPGWRNLDEAELLALITGEDEGSNELERACFAFARAASADPGAVPESLLERLKAQLTPAQIVELAAVVGFWKFFNTVHDSLHIPSEASLAKYWSYLDARGAQP